MKSNTAVIWIIELLEAEDMLTLPTLRSFVHHIVRRVEPTAASSIFLVHGKACTKSDWHPTCSHEEEGVEPLGKLYAINFKELMGEDWRVSASLGMHQFITRCPIWLLNMRQDGNPCIGNQQT